MSFYVKGVFTVDFFSGDTLFLFSLTLGGHGHDEETEKSCFKRGISRSYR